MEETNDYITYRHIDKTLDQHEDLRSMCLQAMHTFKTVRPEIKKKVNTIEIIKRLKEIHDDPRPENYNKRVWEVAKMVTDLHKHLELEQEEGLGL